jgi:hypothetical protein
LENRIEQLLVELTKADSARLMAEERASQLECELEEKSSVDPRSSAPEIEAQCSDASMQLIRDTFQSNLQSVLITAAALLDKSELSIADQLSPSKLVSSIATSLEKLGLLTAECSGEQRIAVTRRVITTVSTAALGAATGLTLRSPVSQVPSPERPETGSVVSGSVFSLRLPPRSERLNILRPAFRLTPLQLSPEATPAYDDVRPATACKPAPAISNPGAVPQTHSGQAWQPKALFGTPFSHGGFTPTADDSDNAVTDATGTMPASPAPASADGGCGEYDDHYVAVSAQAGTSPQSPAIASDRASTASPVTVLPSAPVDGTTLTLSGETASSIADTVTSGADSDSANASADAQDNTGVLAAALHCHEHDNKLFAFTFKNKTPVAVASHLASEVTSANSSRSANTILNRAVSYFAVNRKENEHLDETDLVTRIARVAVVLATARPGWAPQINPFDDLLASSGLSASRVHTAVTAATAAATYSTTPATGGLRL